MMGDDWLNSGRVRVDFGEYLEGELSREVRDHQERLAAAAAERGLDYRPDVRQGNPAECLLACAREIDCELVVIGAPREKGTQGLRSRLDLEILVRGLRLPLLVAPRPT
jgi:nucleotide-binding universal stress UspA family protein